MARDQDGNGIGAAGAADGAGGTGFADFSGDLGITAGAAGGDAAEGAPDVALKFRAGGQIERRQNPGCAAGKGVIEGIGGEAVPAADLRRNFLLRLGFRSGGGEIQPGQAVFRIMGGKAAFRGGNDNFGVHINPE